MRAAVWYGPGRENFRIESLPRPTCSAGGAVIRVRRVFFSAMHTRAILVGHARHRGPVVFGRMLAGDLAEVGAGVGDDLAVGTRVTVNPESPCGGCFYCLRGMAGHCVEPVTLEPGGMADFVRVPAALVAGIHRLGDHVSYEEAAFAETLACVLQGLEVAEIRPGDTVLILGSGGVALCFLQLARLAGASRLLISVRHEPAGEVLSGLGADRVMPSGDRLRQAVLEETRGYGADVVIEAAGTLETYAQALELTRCGGTAVAFGGLPPGSRLPFEPNTVHYRSVRLVGSYRYRPEHFDEAIRLISTRQIDLRPVVTHTIDFDRLTTHAVDVQQAPDCRALVVATDPLPGPAVAVAAVDGRA
jgi:L-iditol 2-dehydrogenase